MDEDVRLYDEFRDAGFDVFVCINCGTSLLSMVT